MDIVVKNILKMTRANSLTDQEVCKLLNTNKSKLSDWKSGKSKPSIYDVITLAKHFGITCDMLIEGKCNAKNSEEQTISELRTINKISKLNESGMEKVDAYIDGLLTSEKFVKNEKLINKELA